MIPFQDQTRDPPFANNIPYDFSNPLLRMRVLGSYQHWGIGIREIE